MSVKPKLIFFIALLITVGLFVYPYFKTRSNPAADGNALIGYPYYAYSFGGGMCAYDGPDRVGGRVTCPPEWGTGREILLDIIFVLGIPLALGGGGYFVQRRKRI